MTISQSTYTTDKTMDQQ